MSSFFKTFLKRICINSYPPSEDFFYSIILVRLCQHLFYYFFLLINRLIIVKENTIGSLSNSGHGEK